MSTFADNKPYVKYFTKALKRFFSNPLYSITALVGYLICKFRFLILNDQSMSSPDLTSSRKYPVKFINSFKY